MRMDPSPPSASATHPAPPGAYPPRNNGLAVASMVLGICGVILFVFFAIPSVLAVVFGSIARGQIRRSQGVQVGRGMATAGIWLGLIEIVVFLYLITTGNGSFYIRFG